MAVCLASLAFLVFGGKEKDAREAKEHKYRYIFSTGLQKEG